MTLIHATRCCEIAPLVTQSASAVSYGLGEKLVATRETLARAPELASMDLVVMQHVVPNTLKFVDSLIEADVGIAAFICKPLSIHEPTLSALRERNLQIVNEPYSSLEHGPILHELIAAVIEKARARGRRVGLIDVGGYMREVLSKLSTGDCETLCGVVEVTTFGHNNYTRSLTSLKAPVVSLARSPLKMAEAVLVGDSAVAATDLIMRRAGIMLQGRQAGMIGFGAIGEPTAVAARAKGMRVTVYDTDPIKRMRARILGFQTVESAMELLQHCHIVFASTGTRSVSIYETLKAKKGTVFVSVGSKGNEYDVTTIQAMALTCH